MSLDVAVRKQSPSIRIWMLPALIPIWFGPFGVDTVDDLDGGWVVEGIVVRSNADDGPVFAMQLDVLVVERADLDAAEEPQSGESSPDGARYWAERG